MVILSQFNFQLLLYLFLPFSYHFKRSSLFQFDDKAIKVIE